MYILKINGDEFKIQGKYFLKWFACNQAKERKANISINNEKEAIKYLKSIKIEVINK